MKNIYELGNLFILGTDNFSILNCHSWHILYRTKQVFPNFLDVTTTRAQYQTSRHATSLFFVFFIESFHQHQHAQLQQAFELIRLLTQESFKALPNIFNLKRKLFSITYGKIGIIWIMKIYKNPSFTCNKGRVY